MPPKKRGPRPPSPKQRKASKVAVRRAFENLSINCAQIGAAILAETQIERRDHALGLIDYRNELSTAAGATRSLAQIRVANCRCVGDVCSCWPLPSLPANTKLLAEIEKQIEIVDEQLKRYTETYRRDWLDSARNGEDVHDAVTRILAEFGIAPIRRDVRYKTKLRRVQKLRRALVQRRAHAQRELEQMSGGKYEPVSRWGDPVSAEQLQAEIARLTRLVGENQPSVPAKREDRLARIEAEIEKQREAWARADRDQRQDLRPWAQ